VQSEQAPSVQHSDLVQQEPEQDASLLELLLRANKTPEPAIATNAVSIKTFFFMIVLFKI
jgi:hypothetical protein